MLFKKKVDEKKWISHLLITLTNGETIGWTHDIKKSGSSATREWNKFLKWYYGRPQSTHYSMKFKTGETLFKREHIYRFTIENYQVTK